MPSLHEDILHRELLQAALGQIKTRGTEPLAGPQRIERLFEVYFDLHHSGKYQALRAQILEGLAWLPQGHSRQAATAILAKKLTQPDLEISVFAAQALIYLGEETPAVTQTLINLARTGTESIRAMAIRYLGMLGIGKPEVRADLLGIVRHYNQKKISLFGSQITQTEGVLLCESAVEALGELGVPDPEVVNGLQETLMQNPWIDVIKRAANALGRLGIEVSGVQAALENALSDTGHERRMFAARVLLQARVEIPDFITQVLRELKAEDSDVQANAAEILGYLGIANPKIVQGLWQAWQQDHVSEAAEALGNLKISDSDVITGLVETLRRDVWTVAGTLGKIGTQTPEVVSALVGELEKPIDQQRDKYALGCVAETLGRLGQATPEVLGQLIRLLKNDNWVNCMRAAEALGRLNVVTPQIVEQLQRALLDDLRLAGKEHFVQAGAALALAHLATQQGESFSNQTKLSITNQIKDLLEFPCTEEISICLFDKEYSFTFDAVWDALFMMCQALDPVEKTSDLQV